MYKYVYSTYTYMYHSMQIKSPVKAHLVFVGLILGAPVERPLQHKPPHMVRVVEPNDLLCHHLALKLPRYLLLRDRLH